MKKEKSTSQLEIYQGNGKNIEVVLKDENVWLTQNQMSELFERDRSVITKHITNIFKEKELDEKSNVHFLHIANSDKPIKTYSLDVIISVGYRVKSKRGTQFRIWATQLLKSYLIEGYVVNEKILKERNTELIHQLQAISLLIINDIPVTKKMAIDAITQQSAK
ncbi:MAG: virulence RhuM family protein [Bacteroidales bacterium]|nr:virulence RhuM family protein [Bacteroidales bacterium]